MTKTFEQAVTDHFKERLYSITYTEPPEGSALEWYVIVVEKFTTSDSAKLNREGIYWEEVGQTNRGVKVLMFDRGDEYRE